MPPFDRSRRKPRPGAASHPPAARRLVQRPPSQRHVVDPRRLAPTDRRPSRADLADLRPIVGGPPTPPPPRLPRTGFESSGPEPRAGRQRFEPIPFHPLWVVVGLLAWAAAWLVLYVASAAFMLVF